MSTRLKILGKTYDLPDLQELTVKDTLLLVRETQELLGRSITFGEVVAMSQRVSKLTAAEREADPEALLVFAITVWGARRIAGESVTFDEAISVPLSAIDVIPDPQDHKPKAEPDPRKPRPRSGRGAKTPVPQAAPQTS